MLKVTQYNYVKDRVTEIWSKKRQAIFQEYKPTELSREERVKLICTGKVKCKSSKDIHLLLQQDKYLDVVEIYDFPMTKAKKNNAQECQKRIDALTVEYQNILDHLMLGDETAALNSINAFTNMNY